MFPEYSTIINKLNWSSITDSKKTEILDKRFTLADLVEDIFSFQFQSRNTPV
jgi:hypothetical protein